MGISDVDAMNDALDVCSDLGFEMVPGFATHWAMGSESLIALGHADLVHGWVVEYRSIHRHFDPPVPTSPIDETDPASWRAALADFTRVGDWRVLFQRSLAEAPWEEVLQLWWERLVPGIAAGLTHGLIRTTHVVRSIDRSGGAASQAQLQELAIALSYWAARYITQPEVTAAASSTPVADVVAAIPRLDPANKLPLMEKGRFGYLHGMPEWSTAVSQVGMPADIETALSDLTLTFARVNAAHLDKFPVPLLHSVTAPAALRLMLPHIPQRLHDVSLWSIWIACSALLTTFATEARPAERLAEAEVETLPEQELIARAVENRDEHAIKFTEACLREYAIRPDPSYLVAAERMQQKIRPVRPQRSD